jgi:hypothetical protein
LSNLCQPDQAVAPAGPEESQSSKYPNIRSQTPTCTFAKLLASFGGCAQSPSAAEGRRVVRGPDRNTARKDELPQSLRETYYVKSNFILGKGDRRWITNARQQRHVDYECTSTGHHNEGRQEFILRRLRGAGKHVSPKPSEWHRSSPVQLTVQCDTLVNECVDVDSTWRWSSRLMSRRMRHFPQPQREHWLTGWHWFCAERGCKNHQRRSIPVAHGRLPSCSWRSRTT